MTLMLSFPRSNKISTFAVNSLSESHNVEYGKAQDDFRVDSKRG